VSFVNSFLHTHAAKAATDTLKSNQNDLQLTLDGFRANSEPVEELKAL
jgi:hypothetical protein